MLFRPPCTLSTVVLLQPARASCPWPPLPTTASFAYKRRLLMRCTLAPHGQAQQAQQPKSPATPLKKAVLSATRHTYLRRIFSRSDRPSAPVSSCRQRELVWTRAACRAFGKHAGPSAGITLACRHYTAYHSLGHIHHTTHHVFIYHV